MLEHRGKRPRIHPSTYIAPTATICGDVSIGENSRILFGAIVVAEGGSVEIGANCIVMENAVIRGTPGFPTRLSNAVLVGPRAYLTGCVVEDNVFLATGVTIFNGAHIGTKAEVRINGVVHVKTQLAPGTMVPIGWVAVGDPAQLFPPDWHDQIWAVQEPLDFPRTVFGMERAPEGETIMPEMMARYARSLGRHFQDKVLDSSNEKDYSEKD